MSTTADNEVDKRAEWLKSRKDSLGATDVAAIMGISPFAGPWDVWADKTNRLDDWDGNSATRAGKAFEPAVLDHAEAELGPLRRDIRIKHPTLPMAATLDAQLIEALYPVEAKTTGIVGPVYGRWGDAMTDEFPDHYLVQVHAQLTVTGADLAYLFALIAGRGVVQFQVRRSESLCKKIGDVCSEWWEKHIVGDREPSIDQFPPALDVVKRLRRVPSKQTTFGPVVTALVKRRDRVNKAKLDIEKRVKELDAKILVALGDAESAILDGGGELTYYETEKKGFYVNPTKYRTLRIKGAK